MMKGIIIFYKDKSSKYADEKVFAGKSARELSKVWAYQLGNEVFTIDSDQAGSLISLLEAAKAACQKASADFAVFSYDDLPFLDLALTQKMCASHAEYKSEYTFADGYPYGFTPEIIDAGTLSILLELARTSQASLGQVPMSRDSIWNLIKTDVNSFEVESELAPHDWRLYRFAFSCGNKENFLQSKALFEALSGDLSKSSDEKASVASRTAACLKTVPGFYNIQISDRVNSNYTYLPYKKAYEEKFKLSPEKASASAVMPFEKFAGLVEKIATFSEKAVISLSNWGEPLTNPELLKMIEKVLSFDGLSVFLETDGLLINDDFCSQLGQLVNKAAPRTNGWQKVMVALSLDAASAETFVKLHDGTRPEDFGRAVEAVEKLQSVIPGMVYPQFVRLNDNESELETFYRYWNEKTNPSAGNLIIQKYDDFAGLLPPCKPADLSPLGRLPCWHLRRDMNILSNGDVTGCHTCILSGVIGNVFESSLEEIWHKTDELLQNHINEKYIEKCESCDEHYTFNF